ncbi:hypothetical protein HMPREF1979_01601 [Actinomyces johnsonii F0542]|uniref:Uncharacterized protein n=1 Tax=Actinomyces johnsonii F0542 TaxID=1321818 RepID=U1Q7Z9_9ACTO|nr:hypothetical protein HMPREF1979_01601 [Actinomyces johnsonii F0542]
MGAVIAWWPAGMEGAALAPFEALALDCAAVPAPLGAAVAAAEEACPLDPVEPADEGAPWEQPARTSAMVRTRAARVALMISPESGRYCDVTLPVLPHDGASGNRSARRRSVRSLLK